MLFFLIIAMVWIFSVKSIIADLILIPPVLFVMIVLHWRTLILPLDLLIGPQKREMYYSDSYGSTEELELFRKKRLKEYKFYFGKNELLCLLSLDESVFTEHDYQHGDLVSITYYRYSRILKSINFIKQPEK